MNYLLRATGVALALGALYWLLHGLDLPRFFSLLAQAHLPFVLLVPVAVLTEQWLRAWKWRQVMWDLCRIPTHHIFLATMAGYVPGLVIGFGTSVLTRCWLIARRSSERTTTLLAANAVDRLVDLLAFAVFVGLTGTLVSLPRSAAAFAPALRWSGAIIAVLAVLAFAPLLGLRHGHLRRLAPALRILPQSAARAVRSGLEGFALGITWPHSAPRRLAIVAMALLIKLIAATQYLWAGLAFGIRFEPGSYLFIMVFLGALVFVGFFVRIPGSSALASIFVLELLDVPKAQALAITLTVEASFMLTIAVIGGVVLAIEGVSFETLRTVARKSAQER